MQQLLRLLSQAPDAGIVDSAAGRWPDHEIVSIHPMKHTALLQQLLRLIRYAGSM